METQEVLETTVIDSVARLSRDLKKAAATLTKVEVRYLVDAFQNMQKQRIRAGNQIQALRESGEPHEVVNWFENNADVLESQVKRALEGYAQGNTLGQWAMSIVGVGPVITAGLMAHIDIEMAPTVGHIWRFAGLDPTQVWYGTEEARRIVTRIKRDLEAEKGEATVEDILAHASAETGHSVDSLLRLARNEQGQVTTEGLIAALAKRPWNARLKTLCWKVGESFKKFSGKEECVYGKVYLQRKAQEIQRNSAGQFAEQAATTLAKYPNHKQRAIYKAGKLPDGRLDLRATRYATKLFLSHYHHVAYELHYGVVPPKPYVLDRLGHIDFVAPPNWPMRK